MTQTGGVFEIVDWGTEFGGGNHDVGGTTIELDGLPPPPAGIFMGSHHFRESW
jgi:hypothetical protein